MTSVRTIEIGGGDVEKIKIGEKTPLTLLAGPCAIESEEHSIYMAKEISKITKKLGIQYIFKSCYNKDCRSSVNSYHGIGLEWGLDILKKVRTEVGIPVTSDVSNVQWMKDTAETVDLIQIPAYLSRQTHLLTAAGKTMVPIHIKKGQFLSPWNMGNAAIKVESTGNKNILLTDRGTFFGYNMLVNDFRCFNIMKKTGYPVCYDATHSIQLPSSLGTSSGGQREHIPSLTRAACAAGINALFMEVHDQPKKALCDATTQLPLKYLENLLKQAKKVYDLTKKLKEIKITE